MGDQRIRVAIHPAEIVGTNTSKNVGEPQERLVLSSMLDCETAGGSPLLSSCDQQTAILLIMRGEPVPPSSTSGHEPAYATHRRKRSAWFHRAQ